MFLFVAFDCILIFYRLSQRKLMLLAGCEIEGSMPMSKTEILIIQSKANFDQNILLPKITLHRPFSYSERESQSNDTLLQFVEFSNVHNSDRSSNAT